MGRGVPPLGKGPPSPLTCRWGSPLLRKNLASRSPGRQRLNHASLCSRRKRAYAAEAQSNTASVLTMDGVLHEALLPELVATELHLLSSTLLQISGLQGQDLVQCLASLIVARRVPDADKAALLDAPISSGHTFGPAVEEILQRSHQEREASRQEATLLPLRASTWGRLNCWRAPQMWTVTRTVPVPIAPLGDLRHLLQGTSTANNWAQLAGRGNAGCGQSTHQRHRRRFQGQCPK
ncbi:UNVERIFIED_CONTAM: hypothetical protein FKN15_035280 [Acipenser sinensis]